MPVVLTNLIAALFFLSACTHAPGLPQPKERAEVDRTSTMVEEDEILLDHCTREQAERWASEAEKNEWAGLRSASCYLFMITRGKDKPQKLVDARRGRQLAEDALRRLPQSGSAHYLAAYLTALEAQLDPLRGLDLVPIIEREALAAADLNPRQDSGGPDRMLGELYLHAPGFPVSVGDSSKAVLHYRRALAQDSSFTENRLGLVEALLAEEELPEACSELLQLFEQMPPATDDRHAWPKALLVLKRMCSMISVD